MKKNKRMFSLFLTLALVLSLLPALSPAARADEPEAVTAAPGTAVTLTATFNNVHWESMQYEKVIISPGGIRQGRTATDYGALALVWRVDGNAVSGGTYEYDSTAGTVTAVYSYSGGSLGETHLVSCDCDVKYSGAEYTSTLGTKSFSVTRRDLSRPVITQQPQSASAMVGGTLTFSVTASNVAAYSWCVCDAAVGQPYGWTTVKAHAAVSGEATATLTLKPSDSWLSGLAVYCDIKGTDGNWYSSSSADITVTDSVVPKPTITTQPVGQTGVKAGTPVTLSVAATGTGTLSYQWYQTAVNDISTIKADTTALSGTYTVPETPGTVYYCVSVTDTVGGKTSDMVYSNLVAVSYEAGKAPAISAQPQSVSKPEGGAATFSVTAAGDDLHYKWYCASGGAVTAVGTDSPTLTVSPLKKAEHDGGSYYCVVTNSSGSATSSKALLTVSAASATPAVDYTPASVTLKKGGTATVTASTVVAESAKGTLSYQWYAGSSSVPSTATVLSGETAASVTVGGGMAEGETRWYFCVVTNTKDGVRTSSFSSGMTGVKVTVQSSAKSAFSDVPPDAYYASAVDWAVEKTVTSGTGADSFAPDVNCNRAQTVTFLWRAAGSPAPAGTASPFTDVAASAYYCKAVLWAAENGVTTGTSATTFSPEAPVTRAAFVTFLWRAADKSAAAGTTVFTDVTDPAAYYSTAVGWAVAGGVTTGTSATTFSPAATCTRAQVVTFLYRYYK